MTKLHSTIAQLGRLRALSLQPPPPSDRGRLSDMEDFGSNPGALRARYYIPKDLRGSHRSRHAPLVVILHGCTQNADVYDHGSGWSQLADELGFALLFPEQRRANNSNRCFNWFAPGDSARDAGEPLSIRHDRHHGRGIPDRRGPHLCDGPFGRRRDDVEHAGDLS